MESGSGPGGDPEGQDTEGQEKEDSHHVDRHVNCVLCFVPACPPVQYFNVSLSKNLSNNVNISIQPF